MTQKGVPTQHTLLRMRIHICIWKWRFPAVWIIRENVNSLFEISFSPIFLNSESMMIYGFIRFCVYLECTFNPDLEVLFSRGENRTSSTKGKEFIFRASWDQWGLENESGMKCSCQGAKKRGSGVMYLVNGVAKSQSRCSRYTFSTLSMCVCGECNRTLLIIKKKYSRSPADVHCLQHWQGES